ncbi:MAG: hypothetical protein ACREMN_02885 [Gemmatimonadales bacterium]
MSRKLHQNLGEEAAEDLVNWMNHVEARVGDGATRSDLAALRADFGEMREAMRADLAELRQEMRVGFAELREEMARLEARFERRFGDLIKWSFVFWVGAVAAIAMLAGVLP